MEKVSVYLELQPEPVSRNSVCEALGGTKDYILKAINALVAEEFVTETAGPRRSKLLDSARSYREQNPVDNPKTDTPDSVVHVWFDSGSANHSGVVVRTGGSVRSTEPVESSTHDHPEPLGWFGTNGNLLDAYFDEIAPDETELE
jgi:isoleucyl-tRNA synthetase